MALWPNGEKYPGDVWSEYGKRDPIETPNGWTSGFHEGIDIGAWNGDNTTMLLSPVDGEVTYVGYDNVFGNRVIVVGEGVMFKLCHGKTGSTLAHIGQKVTQKQELMLMGKTGKAAGVHIHFEVWVGGKHVNPRDYYRFNTGSNKTTEDKDMIVNIQGKAGVRNGGAYYIANGVATFLGANIAGVPTLDYNAGSKLAARVTGDL